MASGSAGTDMGAAANGLLMPAPGRIFRCMGRCLLLMVLGAWVGNALAQTAWARRLGAEPGHPAHSVYRMLVDREGLLWLSTDRGVLSYDGVRFESLPGWAEARVGLVLQLAEDTVHEHLWMAAYGGGIFRWDRRSAHLESFGTPPWERVSATAKARTLLPRPDGGVVVGYDRGLGTWVLHPDGRWEVLPPPQEVEGLHLWWSDAGPVGGTFWEQQPDPVPLVMTGKDGRMLQGSVGRVDNGWDTYLKWRFLRNGAPVVAVGDRVCRWLPDGTLQQEHYGRYVVQLTEDRDGHLWTLEFLGRVRCYAPDGALLPVHLPQVDGLHATDLVQDRQGGIWVSTLGGGLFHARPFSRAQLPQEGAAPAFTCMAAGPGGTLFTGSLYGELVQWSSEGLPMHRWQLAAGDRAVDVKGVQWCRTHERMEAAAPHRLMHVADGRLEATPTVRSAAAYAYQQVHLGADSMLLLNPGGLVLLPEGPHGPVVELVQGTRCFAAAWSGDTLWVAGMDGLRAVGPDRSPGAVQVSGPCTDITLWNGRPVAACRDNGLVRYEDGAWRGFVPEPLAREARAVQCDSLGWLWVAGSAGAFGIHPGGGVGWRSDAFPGPPLTTVDDVVATPDAVWLLSQRTIYRLPREPQQEAMHRPAPRFTSCRVDGRPVTMGEVTFLNADQRDVELHFRVALPERFGQEQYRVRMGSGRFSQIGAGRLDLFNLGPGRQRIEVEAGMPGGGWGPVGSLVLDVAPRLHERLWARLLAGLIVVLLVAAFLRWREFRLRERLATQRDLDRLQMQALTSQLEPHFVFNALNGIQSYLARNDRDAGMRYLARFSRLMRGLLETGQSRVIPLAHEVELLEHYCTLEAMRFSPAFTWRISVHPALDTRRVRVLPYLVQPYVENAVRHGLSHLQERRGELVVEFAAEAPGLLRCTITDNGVGRGASGEAAKGSERTGLGMATNARRLRLLARGTGRAACRVEVQDLVDADGRPAGTRVLLVMPMEQGGPANERSDGNNDEPDAGSAGGGR